MRLNDPRPPQCITSWIAYDPAYPNQPLWWQCLTLAHTEHLPCCLCDASVDDPHALARLGSVNPRARTLYLARGGLTRVIIPRRYRSKKAKERNAESNQTRKTPTNPLQKLINKVPKFMHPDFHLIRTLDDLLYQVSLEIDLAESGSLEPRWTAPQLHRAKMFAATVHLAARNRTFHTELPV